MKPPEFGIVAPPILNTSIIANRDHVLLWIVYPEHFLMCGPEQEHHTNNGE